MRADADNLKAARKRKVLQDFGKDDSAKEDKQFLGRMKQDVYLKKTNVNSLGDRMNGIKDKFARLHDLDEKNMYKR